MTDEKKVVPPNEKPIHPLTDDQQIAGIAKAIEGLRTEGIEDILPLARWSLETVSHLTEYEDEKANRIMTAVAFLSAIVSVAFAAIVQRYPFHASSRLLVLLYCLFGLYFFLLTLGAAFTLLAVRPQFRIPDTTEERTRKIPRSFLFFKQILDVSGEDWGKNFTVQAPNLKTEYAKNAILETYLIAQKIPRKLRWLKRGINCFLGSTWVLVVLLPLCAITVVRVEVPAANNAPALAGTAQSGKDLPTTGTSASQDHIDAIPTGPRTTDGKRSSSAKKDSRRDVKKPQ